MGENDDGPSNADPAVEAQLVKGDEDNITRKQKDSPKSNDPQRSQNQKPRKESGKTTWETWRPLGKYPR